MNKHILSQEQIDSEINSRKELLQKLKSELSLKLFYCLEEKVDMEHKNLLSILDWQEGRNTHLSKFTNVLEPYYFEQEFFN